MVTEPGRRQRPPEIRRAILSATEEELAEKGAERASLRSIARRVGITHQAVTYHFADRRAVLTAVAVDGINRLIKLSTDAVARTPDTVPLGERTVAIGTAYVRFARENRALFSLMVSSTQVDDTDPDLLSTRLRMWNLLLETVRGDSARGWGGPVAPEDMALMAWTFTHGLATLDEKIFGGVDADDLMRTLNRAIIGTQAEEEKEARTRKENENPARD